MTLRSTIKRREQRKRAKSRPKGRSNTFLSAKWVTEASLDEVRRSLRVADHINKQYGK